MQVTWIDRYLLSLLFLRWEAIDTSVHSVRH